MRLSLHTDLVRLVNLGVQQEIPSLLNAKGVLLNFLDNCCFVVHISPPMRVKIISVIATKITL